MFRNYLKIALRNLVKNKVYSLINIIGLGVGIATSLLIFVVVHYELNYDTFQSKRDRLHRVVTTFTNKANGEVTGYESAAVIPLANALRTDFPELAAVAAVWNIGGAQIHIPIPGKDLIEEKRFKEDAGLFFAEPDLFRMFDYSWLAGGAKGLTEPNTCVITESLANLYFDGWKNAMEREIQLWSFRIPMKVVGVFKDLPANTEMQVRIGGSYATFKAINRDWFAMNDWEQQPWPSECFVLLPKGVKAKDIETKLSYFVQKYYPPALRSEKLRTLSLQPLLRMHLDKNFYTFKGDALTTTELWSLGLIGLFLLLVACINFVNLATSQSVIRAKEVGVRKVLGGTRITLLKQFLNETALITGAALLLAYLLAYAALPYIRELMGKPLSINLAENLIVFLFLLLLGVVVTFLAGFYPGMVLSGFNAIDALKTKINTRSIGGISLRKSLVVLQFVIAQFLIIGTVVVIRQMQFFNSRPLGFQKNATAVLELPSDSVDQLSYPYLKEQILKVPGIEAASFCMDAPASFGSNNHPFYLEGSVEKTDFGANLQFSDTSYLTTFQIKLIAGRLFFPSDTMRELLVNETLARKVGARSPEEIIGKRISFDGTKFHSVVGVMKDFNSKPLKQAIEPLVLATNNRTYNFISMRINPAQMQQALSRVHTIFTKQYPTYIYDLTFLDDRVNRFYKAEAKAAKLFQIAAALAIFISCIGLYGLVSFMAVQKTKEVGIRKVLGASVQSIVYLFSREFTLLIGIAFLIAAPLGYWLMNSWLSSFHYHIHIGWSAFVLAIVLSIIIAWITIGYKAVKAAWVNPVKSLRTE